jgi:serine protease Do
MDIEQLTKTQLVLLVLLVSFVTSLVTGIVAVTLVNQAPAPITQTVSKVVEKTIETVVPSEDGGEPKTTEEVVQVQVITQEDLIIQLVETSASAVVSIIATKDIPIIEQYFISPFGDDEFFNRFFPEELLPQFGIPQYRQKGTEKTQVSSGTGFFVSEDGFLLTNKHVVLDTEAEYVIIMNDGRQFKAEVLARDPVQDIAVLKVEGEGFNYIPLGNSDSLKVGQTVVAIGNVLGEFQNTVSAGVVSGLNRTVVAAGAAGELEQLQEVIQTDAAINPGNSGGPLLGLSGRVIGINTAMAQGAENVGFALPINFAKKGIDDVKEFGEIKYAFLGVRYLSINSSIKEEKELPVSYGVLLIKGPQDEPAIIADSPAEKADLKEGDIILEFDGVKIDKDNSLAKLINTKRVGDIVKLKVLRGEENLEIEVTLDGRPESL